MTFAQCCILKPKPHKRVTRLLWQIEIVFSVLIVYGATGQCIISARSSLKPRLNRDGSVRKAIRLKSNVQNIRYEISILDQGIPG